MVSSFIQLKLFCKQKRMNWKTASKLSYEFFYCVYWFLASLLVFSLVILSCRLFLSVHLPSHEPALFHPLTSSLLPCFTYSPQNLPSLALLPLLLSTGWCSFCLSFFPFLNSYEAYSSLSLFNLSVTYI